MVSKRIISSAKFLQMPLEAQALYFHLTINADDDGVAEAYPITRLLGTNADVIKILLAKDFIRQLNEDQVILINNWTEHNTIRADRKIDSIYKNLLPKDVKYIEAKPRSDVKDNSKRIGGQSTDGISKDKLSQVKLSKGKKKRASPKGEPTFFTLVKDYFISSYKNKFGKKPAIDFGKDGRIVNKTKGLFRADEWKKLIDDFLTSQKAKELGYSLSICFSTHTINTWQANGLDKFINANFNN